MVGPNRALEPLRAFFLGGEVCSGELQSGSICSRQRKSLEAIEQKQLEGTGSVEKLHPTLYHPAEKAKLFEQFSFFDTLWK